MQSVEVMTTALTHPQLTGQAPRATDPQWRGNTEIKVRGLVSGLWLTSDLSTSPVCTNIWGFPHYLKITSGLFPPSYYALRMERSGLCVHPQSPPGSCHSVIPYMCSISPPPPPHTHPPIRVLRIWFDYGSFWRMLGTAVFLKSGKFVDWMILSEPLLLCPLVKCHPGNVPHSLTLRLRGTIFQAR